MTVILKDTVPPIAEIAKLSYAAVAVYSLMHQSAIRIYDMTKEFTGNRSDLEAVVAQQTAPTRLLRKPYIWERKGNLCH